MMNLCASGLFKNCNLELDRGKLLYVSLYIMGRHQLLMMLKHLQVVTMLAYGFNTESKEDKISTVD